MADPFVVSAETNADGTRLVVVFSEAVFAANNTLIYTINGSDKVIGADPYVNYLSGLNTNTYTFSVDTTEYPIGTGDPLFLGYASYPEISDGDGEYLQNFTGFPVTNNVGAAVQGEVDSTLDDVTVASTGYQPQQTGAAAITIDSVTVAATAVSTNQGSVATTLDDITVDAFGSLPVEGTLSQSIDAVAVSSSGFAGDVATGAVALTIDNVSAVATAQLDIVGAASLTVADVSVVATGSTAAIGSAAITIDAVTAGIVGIARPKRRSRGLFPSNLLLDSQFVLS